MGTFLFWLLPSLVMLWLAQIARERGRTAAYWFWLGMFFVNGLAWIGLLIGLRS